MYTEKYIPKVCLDEGETKATYEGHVMLLRPSVKDYFEYAGEISKIAKKDEEKKDQNPLEDAVKYLPVIELSKKFYQEIYLKHKESGLEYKSFDDLYNDVVCTQILFDIAMYVASMANPEKK